MQREVKLLAQGHTASVRSRVRPHSEPLFCAASEMGQLPIGPILGLRTGTLEYCARSSVLCDLPSLGVSFPTKGVRLNPRV